jgi:hypothetical protein
MVDLGPWIDFLRAREDYASMSNVLLPSACKIYIVTKKYKSQLLETIETFFKTLTQSIEIYSSCGWICARHVYKRALSL